MLKALVRLEGSHPQAYLDIADVLTIGVGHVILPKDNHLNIVLGRPYKRGDELSDKQVLQLLELDLGVYISAVNSLIKVELTQNQFDALVMFAFNVGVGALSRSTLRRKLNAGDYLDVSNQIMRWTKARVRGKLKKVQGLVNRRETERQIFFLGTELEELHPRQTFRARDMAMIADIISTYKGGESNDK